MTKGPLWKALHLTGFKDGSARLFFAFHHLIIDAVSWRIIADDMQTWLTNSTLLEEHTAAPSPKTSSYRQWVSAVKAYAKTHEDEVNYWQSLEKETPWPDSVIFAKTRHSQIALDAEYTRSLLREAHQAYFTDMNDLLLSALTQALEKTFSRKRYHITLEGHGRESIDDKLDLSRTVGWFTTLYPICLTAKPQLTDTIIDCKETLRQVPNKGMGYLALQQAGSLQTDLPAITFNYLGQFDKHLPITGDAKPALWQITDEDCGESIAFANQDRQILTLNGYVLNGQLVFILQSRFSKKTHLQFAAAYRAALLEVIHHCRQVAKKGGQHTPSDYPATKLSKARLKKLQQRFPQGIADIFPASSLQQGFIVAQLREASDDAYRVQQRVDYPGVLDTKTYKEAWQLAIWRYPALRLAFDWDGDSILQIITAPQAEGSVNITQKTIKNLSPEAREEAVCALQKQDRQQGFDLTQTGLLRLTLISQSDQLTTVILTNHHCLIDGWSTPLLWQTLDSYYQQLRQGKRPTVSIETTYPLAQTYVNQQQTDSQQYWTTQKTYWHEKAITANNIHALLNQTLDLDAAKTIKQPVEYRLCVQEEAWASLKTLCQREAVTINALLQFAWHKLLQSYTQDSHTLVGTTVSGRAIPVTGIDSSVGLYINTLPMWVDWTRQHSCLAQIQAIQQNIADINNHSGVTLSSLQEKGERLFHTLFIYENYPAIQTVIAQTPSSQRQTVLEKTDYPLTVSAYEYHEQLMVFFESDAKWLDETQALRLQTQLQTILKAVCDNPYQSHQQIPILSEKETHRLLVDWQQTTSAYPHDKTLHQLFEDQVKKTPDTMAVAFEDQQLSYATLNACANQLAREIRQQHYACHHQPIQADTLIALYLDRSSYMVISILAVLKAGAAYVPLAPDYPQNTNTVYSSRHCRNPATHRKTICRCITSLPVRST